MTQDVKVKKEAKVKKEVKVKNGKVLKRLKMKKEVKVKQEVGATSLKKKKPEVGVTPEKHEKTIVDVKKAIAKSGTKRCEITGYVWEDDKNRTRIHVKTFTRDSWGPLYIKAGEALERMIKDGNLSKNAALKRLGELPA